MNIAAGRKALVTGGASGIGLEVARQLAAEGAAVALLDLDEEKLAAAAADVGAGTVTVRADVGSPGQVRAAVEGAVDRLGGLDTLVICAGVIHVKPLAEVTEADWDHTLDVNLKGAFLCCQAAESALRASRRGRIVTISSDAGRRGVPHLLAYSASKFGLVGLTESLAAELAPSVTVNTVCPVGVPTTGMGQQLLSWKTEHTGQDADRVLSGIANAIPMARNGTASDVANAVLYFVSEAASFITGVSLDVDGGSRLNTLPGAAE
ncbi:SDR family NAD(P)-dependent oxidoreductase [Pseudonocardia acaciae]|uniref:SDR family NAD(P)-dependent oxidoreductase n=1 Tax=Pseudonocardia acaciae TaxID=551276 RepID=UPI000689095B|nr:SDR family NAD(P)-dependent oxidoreductase [Pseudonocardia acaciae]